MLSCNTQFQVLAACIMTTELPRWDWAWQGIFLDRWQCFVGFGTNGRSGQRWGKQMVAIYQDCLEISRTHYTDSSCEIFWRFQKGIGNRTYSYVNIDILNIYILSFVLSKLWSHLITAEKSCLGLQIFVRQDAAASRRPSHPFALARRRAKATPTRSFPWHRFGPGRTNRSFLGNIAG